MLSSALLPCIVFSAAPHVMDKLPATNLEQIVNIKHRLAVDIGKLMKQVSAKLPPRSPSNIEKTFKQIIAKLPQNHE